jgi:hypothetical protein
MLNILKLNSLEGIEEYRTLLSSLNNSQPYCLLEYFDVFCGGFENLICFSFRSDNSESKILMTGYLKPITIGEERTDSFDFITPYGYTGPFFSSNTKQSDINEFWKTIDNWYQKNNVVTEFIRFNLSGNQEHYSGTVFPTMLNIKGQIIDEETQWSSFDAKVRKNVNKAKRENLYSEVYYGIIEDEKVSEFYDIYIKTMKRTDANESFFYTLEQFKIFIKYNPKHTAICTVYFDGTAISSELILVSDDTIYSFLGGTEENYFDKRPNDFLKIETLNWARKHNKKHYVLGGGYGFEDGIFKYKKAFFPNDVVPYYTGRKIINQDVYDDLVQNASRLRIVSGLEKLDVTDSSFFPLYNKPY